MSEGRRYPGKIRNTDTVAGALCESDSHSELDSQFPKAGPVVTRFCPAVRALRGGSLGAPPRGES